MYCPNTVVLICLLLVHVVLCYHEEDSPFNFKHDCERPCFYTVLQMAESIDSSTKDVMKMCHDIAPRYFVEEDFCLKLVKKASRDEDLIWGIVKYDASGKKKTILKLEATEKFCAKFCRKRGFPFS
ncbi:hypothetical protein OESDEN_24730 [Oesophagostomum dentatum]|uniref:PAN domain protein n=1 Tax=Oesophagostomum dentatum TaxID=61180 RepID=A0A0B1RSN1_OESDE|nr:hypothetical protein OESDEN_24730 [Oesophagostomum dentatum]